MQGSTQYLSPIFGYIIYFAFVFGYVEKSFGRLGGALASLKEVYWYIINSHLPHLTFLVFSFFSVGGGHGLAWSARHAWQKRGKNITHNSNNYFFNLLLSRLKNAKKKCLFSRLFLAKPGKRACLTLRAWERTNNNLNSPWCCLWNPNVGHWVGGNNCKY